MILPREHFVAERDCRFVPPAPSAGRQLKTSFVRVAIGWLFCLLTLSANAGAQMNSDAADQTDRSAQDSLATAGAERELIESLTEIESRIASLESALLSLDATPSNQWLLQSYQLEHDQLRYLDIIYSQHLALIQSVGHVDDEDAAIEAELKQFRDQQLIAGESSSFAEVEQLRDVISKHYTRLRTFEAEISSGEAIAEVLTDRLADEERQRRALAESIESTEESLAKNKLERELVTTELLSRITRANLEKQLLEIEYRKRRLESTQVHLETLEQLLATIEPNVTFTEADLDKFLTQLQRKESSLRAELAAIQQQLDSVNGDPMRAAANHESLSSLERAVVLETVKHLRENLQMRMSFINSTLAELVVMQYCWKLRFDIFRNEATEEQIDTALDVSGTYLARLQSARELTNLQLDEARGIHESVTDRIDEERASGSALVPWLEMRVQALEAFFDVGNSRLAHVQYAETFFARLEGEVQANQGAQTGGATLAGALGSIQSWWKYEIFAVDDNPITMGKLITAIVMLLAGLFLSRRLSRTVGCRMLPRLGMHEGASLATQTIVFYALTVVCLLFTLEMLSIPLTVFTFLGGAAAIAVGFGSQTLLNNFISGLIILGEQPARVGDLVEIDGVQGNISHIGARSTKIKTGANVEIVVPNSKFMEQHLTNWTLSNEEIRTQVNVGVAYGTPTEKVFELLQRALDENDAVLKSPDPIILFADFGSDALQFELHFWIKMKTVMQGRRIESNVRRAVDRLFREHDITIAFPQRDVHLDLQRPIEVNLSKQLNGMVSRKAA